MLLHLLIKGPVSPVHGAEGNDQRRGHVPHVLCHLLLGSVGQVSEEGHDVVLAVGTLRTDDLPGGVGVGFPPLRQTWVHVPGGHLARVSTGVFLFGD